MNIPKELQELRAEVETLIKKYKEVRGLQLTKLPSPRPFRPSKPPNGSLDKLSSSPPFKSSVAPGDVTQVDPNEPDEDDQRFQELEDLLFQLVSNVHRRINGMEDSFYNYTYDHGRGHLPKILGSEKMSACLKTLGLDGDYEVWKPMITAASTQYGFEIKK